MMKMHVTSKIALLAVPLGVLLSCAVGQSQTIPIMQVFELTAEPRSLQDPPIPFEDSSGNVIDIEMVALDLRSIDPINITELPTGDFQVDSFFDIEYRIQDSSGTTTTHHIPDSFFDIEYRLSSSTADERTFETEILSMNLSGSRPPAGPIQLRAAPIPPGHVTVLKIADLGGGDFQVESFFDVFLELSTDGGNTFNPATVPATVLKTATVRIPEPGAFVLTLVGVVGLACRRRHRR